ncbi:MAG TPA: VCBS repeat-containing protein, partial [Terriglobia bacterium]|nr:VCBS repeat-containing protein [Terriglobia bacterium]
MPSIGRAAGVCSAFPEPSERVLAAAPVGTTAAPQPGSRPWTPLTQALDRFHNGAHRFSSEQMMHLLAPAVTQLETRLRLGAEGVEDLLATDFRGLSIVPARESTLRDDSVFRIWNSEWAGPQAPAASPQEFAGLLQQYLAPHAPLTLADLACLATLGSPEDQPASIHTRLRFELAGPVVTGSKRTWQATGVWQIEWNRDDTSWKIAAWRPIEMVTVEGPEAVFRDVTEAAFASDPTYRTHLLRDTNYWRSSLDKASGVDIFGNSGVSVGDADGDGRDEIYLCQPQGLPNRLYRQRSPGVFEDFALQAGVDVLDNTSMALFADLLNRGRQDLIVITETSPVLFLNNGNGRFTLKRDAFPPGAVQAALTGAAMADYDRDGYLDLYVCAYGYVEGEGSTLPCPYYDAHNGPPNRLFHNQGDGTFVDVTTASGLDRGNDRFSFACAWNDVDDDGWPDLAVVNDFGRNNLYRNLRNGTFAEVMDALPGFGSGMSAAFADFNGDGRADLYVSNMWVPAGERVTADAGFRQRLQDLPRDLVRQFAMGNAFYANTG